jgi:hypothetical protein
LRLPDGALSTCSSIKAYGEAVNRASNTFGDAKCTDDYRAARRFDRKFRRGDAIGAGRIGRTGVEIVRRSPYAATTIQAVEVPSVITLNATAAGLASNWFLFGATDLSAPDYEFCVFDTLAGYVYEQRARRDDACAQCAGRLGAEDSMPLITLPG